MQISELKNAEILFQLEQQNFQDFYSIENCKEELENPNKHYFCAIIENKTVAYAGIMVVHDQAEILRIAVNSEFRRKGVAQALFNYCLAYIQSKNINEIFLEVSDKNISAINFYRKNNFNQLYVRKNYYSDNSNAIIMQRSV